MEALALRMMRQVVPSAPEEPKDSVYTWYGCDLVTGRIVEELPVVASGLPRLIGSFSTAQVSIPLPDAPATWEVATEPGRSLLICSRDSDQEIVWGGYVTNRVGGSASDLELSLATPEAYFDRRYVGSGELALSDEAEIVLWLTSWADEEGIGFEYDVPETGVLRDRTYEDTEDRTVYSALTELSGEDGGPEWTVRLLWNSDQTAVRKVFTLRSRLGRASDKPEAVFDYPGTVKDYEFVEDFTNGVGANEVRLYGEGEGDDRPASDVTRDEDLLAAGFPRFELRETRAGVTRKKTLDSHARELLAFTRRGGRALTVEADAATAPLYRTEWNLGDDVALDVSSSYRHPNGLHVIGRAIGAELDPSPGGSVAPIILFDDQRKGDA